MKHLYSLVKSLAVFVLILSVPGCSKDNEKDGLVKVTLSYPVYESKANVLASIKSGEPRTLGTPGKIFIYGKYLFINEIDKGVHVFDNSDAKNPKAVAFISIPGNLDIAVKGNTLYADMYGDLITIDISQPMNAKLLKNIAHVFPERGYYYDSTIIVVGWIQKDTLMESPLFECFNCDGRSFALANSKASGSGAPGIAGSMARLSIVNDYLYTVNNWNLGVFDIHAPSEPLKKGDFYVGMNIETIYPFKNKLFIGSSSGMFIYDIGNPEQPQQQGSFSHARACDPVVADDEHAFVTLRTGNECNGTSNQLDAIDVGDLSNPKLLRTYPLSNPHGLAKDGDLLFVCDGTEGLKIFDARDAGKLKMLRQLKGMKAYDVIAWNKRLLMVADEGLFQYDYSNGNISLLSVIRSDNKITRSWVK